MLEPAIETNDASPTAYLPLPLLLLADLALALGRLGRAGGAGAPRPGIGGGAPRPGIGGGPAGAPMPPIPGGGPPMPGGGPPPSPGGGPMTPPAIAGGRRRAPPTEAVKRGMPGSVARGAPASNAAALCAAQVALTAPGARGGFHAQVLEPTAADDRARRGRRVVAQVARAAPWLDQVAEVDMREVTRAVHEMVVLVARFFRDRLVVAARLAPAIELGLHAHVGAARVAEVVRGLLHAQHILVAGGRVGQPFLELDRHVQLLLGVECGQVLEPVAHIGQHQGQLLLLVLVPQLRVAQHGIDDRQRLRDLGLAHLLPPGVTRVVDHDRLRWPAGGAPVVDLHVPRALVDPQHLHVLAPW